MPDYPKAHVIKVSELESFCPPKHVDTDSWVLIGQDQKVEKFVLFLTEIRPGGKAELDVHPGREHCYFVLSGIGDAQVNGEKFTIHPGDCLWIPPDAEHGVKPVGSQTLRFAVVTSPPPWAEV